MVAGSGRPQRLVRAIRPSSFEPRSSYIPGTQPVQRRTRWRGERSNTSARWRLVAIGSPLTWVGPIRNAQQARERDPAVGAAIRIERCCPEIRAVQRCNAFPKTAHRSTANGRSERKTTRLTEVGCDRLHSFSAWARFSGVVSQNEIGSFGRVRCGGQHAKTTHRTGSTPAPPRR
jgi:hypothetical protein